MNRKISGLQMHGDPLSPGIAIGTVYKFRQIDLHSLRTNPFQIEKVENELSRFNDSIRKSRDQLLVLEHEHTDQEMDEIAAIFTAQLHLLNDSAFLKSIEQDVEELRLNIEHILSNKIGELEKSFAAIENELIRTRIADIQDVYHRLLRNLLQIEHVRVTPLLRSKSNAILVSEHLLPSDIGLLNLKNIGAITIEEGSTVSHVAVIARSLNIPVVINLQGLFSLIEMGNELIVDGYSGTVVINPDDTQKSHFRQLKKKLTRHTIESSESGPCFTKDGIRIRIEANANTPDEIEEALANGGEGIGLVRSEFFYLSHPSLPKPTEEFNYYKHLVIAASNAPITIRLLDIGADKALPYLNMPEEKNPQLGIRGIRFLLNHPTLMKNQITNIVKASRYGQIKIMIPFVSLPQEVLETVHMINTVCTELGSDRTKIKIGIMIEIPAIIWQLENIVDLVDFMSIGSNDLIQYLYAVNREEGSLEKYRQQSLPVFLQILSSLLKFCSINKKELSICGEIASNPFIAALLAGAGLRQFSIRIPAISQVRHSIESKSIDQLQQIYDHFLSSGLEDSYFKASA